MSINKSTAKRGDTIIEVMIAFAIFSLVAIISIGMMNSGLSASERSLELVTARNELNAQAEALRFIHSSYIAEANLPECGSPEDTSDANNIRCRQYQGLWERVTRDAIRSDQLIEYPPSTCREIYDTSSGPNALFKSHAFVINTRLLNYPKKTHDPNLLANKGIYNGVFLSADTNATNTLFAEPTMNSRIIYTEATVSDDTTEKMTSLTLAEYTNIVKVEGIWVIPVKGPVTPGRDQPQYYDFYIETCWYGSNTNAPTSIDTVVRLYNPEGV